jgi:uncharacterized protein (TIGR00730 family)
MQSVCVFCGSSMGNKPEYRLVAETLGSTLAAQGIRLVYGGSNVGLMRVVADAALQNGGEVVGVMPHGLISKEIVHNGISSLHSVKTMAERKAMMVDLSDAFIPLPGGWGTLDELSEILTFNQLRISDKPLGLLNTAGYFDHLLRFFDHGVTEGFVRAEHCNNLIVAHEVPEMLERLQTWQAIETGKWIADIIKESLVPHVRDESLESLNL